EGSDQDAYDNESIHLVAKQGAHVIGTVRVFPAGDGNGHWIGGRLAVKKGLRSSGAGELLVRHAVMCVKQQGCTHFTAHIQAENIPFFEQLGWRGIGPAKTYFGRPHHLMEAELGT
ncbi:MAG: GNAT family N-acetyltransferase, partial [Deltaproteobacteria bacterium]